MKFWFPLLLLFAPFSTQAEIFLWVDDNGDKHYSDLPHPNAQTLQVDPGYTYHKIKKVYDGDTILLDNGKKVRFLGINTPEVEGRNKSAQRGGEEAKTWLLDKLKNNKIRLEHDVEKQDKYSRLLAHVFTEDKEHINLELVKKGLASVTIHPPNLKYTDALLAAQQQAEQIRLGIWSYKEYKPRQVSQIKNVRFKGWQRVMGRIKNLRHTRKYSYLNFSDTFALKIERKSSELFAKLESYVGKKVEARGWINKNKNRYNMLIRHPSAIIIINSYTVGSNL
ncbi:MAG: thermonuclease family protein [Methylococcales bacterium]|nr:thermonuclease family protein [Methylococcales bacterium]